MINDMRTNGLQFVQSTASQIDLSISRDSQTIVILGDSITEANSNATNEIIYSNGYYNWANVLSGGRFTLLDNLGIGGQTSSQILARVDTEVIPLKPTHCMFLCGMNNGSDSTQTAGLKSDIIAIYEKLNSHGIYSFILTCTPTKTEIEKNKQAVEINNWMFSYFECMPNCEVIDIYSALVDPTSLTGALLSTSAYDERHPTNLGGYKMGLEIAKSFARFKSRHILPTSAYDANNLNSKSNNYAWNPLIQGTSGINGSGSTGTVTTNAQILNDANITSIASIEARSDGIGNNQVINITATGFGANHFEAFASYLPQIGDKIKIALEVEVISCTNLDSIVLQCNTTGVLTNQTMYAYPTPKYELPLAGKKLVLETSVKTYTSNTTGFLRLRLDTSFIGAGSAVIKAGRVSIRKI